MEKIGLIAGYGDIPVLMAKEARAKGMEVIAIALKEVSSPEIEKEVDRVYWVGIGQLGKLIKVFKKERINKAVMGGKVRKSLMFGRIKPDLRALGLWAKLKDRKDDSILLAVAAELGKEGIALQDSTRYLSSYIAAAGILTKRRPTAEIKKDIDFGWKMAKEIGRLDIGQTVVVKDRAVLAVEAIEGTDEAILRGGRLGRGGVTVVKTSKPNQDKRFDVPVVGSGTMKALLEAQAVALAVEAGKTILINKNEMIETANKEGIVIVGL